MIIVVEATIEEFEQGAWVADLISVDQFDGSFQLNGEAWTGTMVSERLEFERYHTRVIGGKNNLSKALLDKFYSGSVSLQIAAGDACREGGESLGSAQAGVFLQTYQRQRGPLYAALDSLALAFGLIWWIDRAGAVNLSISRPVSGEAKGLRISSSYDSVLLREPETSVKLGAVYDGKPIRHLRWEYTPKRFEARVYFVPFLFRAPVETKYDRTYSALVDRDNSDGTIDVIADARFGVTKVRLLAGVPGSKVKMMPGEEVTLGFFGGDPQKPYAVAMAQNLSATKEVARKGDTIQSTQSVPPNAFWTWIAAAGSVLSGLGVAAPIPTQLDGTITSGSQRLKVGD